MLTSFAHLKGVIKIKDYSIDNIGFKLHYKVTTFLLLVATVLVTSRQYIGEHIKCISDGIPEHVMNTFCFFTTTFTMMKHYDKELLTQGSLPHPGVGPLGINTDDELKRHAYYQWVPFVLFAQAIMFYLPHLVWKSIEGGKLKILAEGLRIGVITDADSFDCKGMHITGKSERDIKLRNIRRIFIDRGELNRSWSRWLIICESLNLLNVLLQSYVTHVFLSGQFYSLGIEIMTKGFDDTADVLDVVFPKVTKCTFRKYGPSGTIQTHDAMCIMALNIINEKIYAFLWFWFIFLFISSVVALLWRFVSIILHARSKKFNQLVFSSACPGKLNPWKVLTITRHCNYTDWLFLNYLSGNMDRVIFRDLFISLASELDEMDDNNVLLKENDLFDESSPDTSRSSTYKEYKEK